jgi:hypothetical protein
MIPYPLQELARRFVSGQFQYRGSNFSLVCRHDSLPTRILLAMLFLLSMSWSFLQPHHILLKEKLTLPADSVIWRGFCVHITPPYVCTVGCCFDWQLWVAHYGIKFRVKEMPTWHLLLTFPTFMSWVFNNLETDTEAQRCMQDQDRFGRRNHLPAKGSRRSALQQYPVLVWLVIAFECNHLWLILPSTEFYS